MRYVQNVMTAVVVLLGLLGARAAAGQETLIHSFGLEQPGPDGSQPVAGLLIDSKGDLFGTTIFGGTSLYGTVFKLSPLLGGGWTETVLHNFSVAEANPDSALISDTDGNLYGTTQSGGEYGFEGTVFELSPDAGGNWTEKTIYTFGSSLDDGLNPEGGLTFDAHGNLYGTTYSGGAYGAPPGTAGVLGTVFKLTPLAGGAWSEKVLYSFGATSTDGNRPEGGVVIDSAGNLFGTTTRGGPAGYDGGTAFEMIPQSDGSWTEKILHNFYPFTDPTVEGDGYYPASRLILDREGNLFGTTVYGGLSYGGTVFKLSPEAGGNWTEKVFGIYRTSASGFAPYAGLSMGANGNLYGVTSAGGAYITSSRYGGGGTVFEVALQPNGGWTENVLHSFPSTAFEASSFDGSNPLGTVIFDSKGNLYSTTDGGGTEGGGTVFEIAASPTPLIGTTTTLIANPNTNLVAGEAITLTATVTPASGTAIPAGTVTFADPSVPGGRATKPLSGGVAVYTGRVPPAGTYSVFASYSGSVGFYSSASATITKTVTAAPE